jgi:sigma-E factor negative regulatory protein RseC
MNNPTGTIQAFIADADGTRVLVAVDVSAVCPRCAAGKGCGAGILGGRARVRQLELDVRDDLTLAEGDNVEIALASANLLQAALIVYGLPLLGAVAAAGLAYLIELGDAAAALAAIAGLSAGVFAGRRRLGQDGCLEGFIPSIVRRLPQAQAGS